MTATILEVNECHKDSPVRQIPHTHTDHPAIKKYKITEKKNPHIKHEKYTRIK